MDECDVANSCKHRKAVEEAQVYRMGLWQKNRTVAIMITGWLMLLRSYGFRFIVPLVLWMLLIFVASSIQANVYPRVNWWGWAKIVHLVFYGVLCFLSWRAIMQQERYPQLVRHAESAALIVVLLYGASDEFHQIFTAGRHPSVLDVFIDCGGACLFLAGLFVYKRLRTAPTERV